MNRDDKSKFLLYIEPKKEEKSKEPVIDNITNVLTFALSKAKKGAGNYSNRIGVEDFYDTNWRGSHKTECGAPSDNHDYLLENGMITNSLAPFYAMWYRNSIKKNDMDKIEKLVDFYKVNTQKKIFPPII